MQIDGATLLPKTVPYAGMLALLTFVIQHSTGVLLVRFTKTRLDEEYNSCVAVFFQEIFKLPICLTLYCLETKGLLQACREIKRDFVRYKVEWLQMWIPAVFYTAQMNLLYFGYEHVEAAIGQVTYQTKILFTAIFSVCLLSRTLNTNSWVALVILMCGVGLAQVSKKRTMYGDTRQYILGLLSLVLAACFSAFGSVYLEAMIKSKRKPSLWLRNIQLSIYGSCVAFLGVAMQDDVVTHGLLYGFHSLVWFSVIWQAFGGLVVALTIKYADNLLRCFAQAIAILIVSIVSWFYCDLSLTSSFISGVIMIVTAMLLYGDDNVVSVVKRMGLERAIYYEGESHRIKYDTKISCVFYGMALGCTLYLVFAMFSSYGHTASFECVNCTVVLHRNTSRIHRVVIHVEDDEWKLARFKESIRASGLQYDTLNISIWPGVIVRKQPDILQWAIDETLIATPAYSENLGNIGAALAHITLWSFIANKTEDGTYAVFEDNVLYTNKSEDALTFLSTLKFDFLNMRVLRPLGKATNIDGVLRMPNNFWPSEPMPNVWLSSYMITPIGARKLLREFQRLQCDVSQIIIDRCEVVALLSSTDAVTYIVDDRELFGHVETHMDLRQKENGNRQ